MDHDEHGRRRDRDPLWKRERERAERTAREARTNDERRGGRRAVGAAPPGLRAAQDAEMPKEWASSDEDAAGTLMRAVLRPAARSRSRSRQWSPVPAPNRGTWATRVDRVTDPEPKPRPWRERVRDGAREEERFLMSKGEMRLLVRDLVSEELQRLDDVARERDQHDSEVRAAAEVEARAAAGTMLGSRTASKPIKKNKKKKKERKADKARSKSDKQVIAELRSELAKLKLKPIKKERTRSPSSSPPPSCSSSSSGSESSS